MELESYKNGTLLYQGAKSGEKIDVNELLCIIGEPGMNIDAILAAAKGGAAPQQQPSSPEVQAAAPQQAQTAQSPTAQPAVVNEGRIIASPLAKKLAEEKGIDLRYVKGSADNGRIVKQDIDNFKTTQQPTATQQPSAPAQPVVQPQTPQPEAPAAAAPAKAAEA